MNHQGQTSTNLESPENTEKMTTAVEEAAATPVPAIQQQPLWKRHGRLNLGADCSTYCCGKIIKYIDTELSLCGILDRFKASCFGHFLSFDAKAPRDGPLLLQLLDREIVVADASPHELWFRIGDRSLRFSKLEFCLITGLNFGASTFDPHSPNHVLPINGVYIRLFDGQTVKAIDLCRRFRNGDFRDCPDDALKISFVLLITMYLFGKDERAPVPRWLWSLVEQPVLFNNFPWGAYFYQQTLHYLNAGLVRPSRKGGRRSRYHIYGFSMALQLWAFECIPELGKQLSLKVSDGFPRGIRWRSRRKSRNVSSIILNARNVNCIEMEPTLREMGRPYMSGIEIGIPEGVRYERRRQSQRVRRTTRPEAVNSDATSGPTLMLDGDETARAQPSTQTAPNGLFIRNINDRKSVAEVMGGLCQYFCS